AIAEVPGHPGQPKPELPGRAGGASRRIVRSPRPTGEWAHDLRATMESCRAPSAIACPRVTARAAPPNGASCLPSQRDYPVRRGGTLAIARALEGPIGPAQGATDRL